MDVPNQKNERACDFCKKDVELLRSLVKKYSSVVLNKKGNGVVGRSKEDAWRKIAHEYNAATTPFRSCIQLNIAWELMKKNMRKASKEPVGRTCRSETELRTSELLIVHHPVRRDSGEILDSVAANGVILKYEIVNGGGEGSHAEMVRKSSTVEDAISLSGYQAIEGASSCSKLDRIMNDDQQQNCQAVNCESASSVNGGTSGNKQKDKSESIENSVSEPTSTSHLNDKLNGLIRFGKRFPSCTLPVSRHKGVQRGVSHVEIKKATRLERRMRELQLTAKEVEVKILEEKLETAKIEKLCAFDVQRKVQLEIRLLENKL